MNFTGCFKLQREVATVNNGATGLCDRCGKPLTSHEIVEQIIMSTLFEAAHGVACIHTIDGLHGVHPLMIDSDTCDVCGLPQFMHPESTSLQERKKLYDMIKLGEHSSRKQIRELCFAAHMGMLAYLILYSICYKTGFLRAFLPTPMQLVVSQIGMVYFGFTRLNAHLRGLRLWYHGVYSWAGWLILVTHLIMLLLAVQYSEWLKLKP